MIRFLVQRPTAVLVSFLGIFIIGIITYLNIPISLLPHIPIPEITVQIEGKNKAARDLEANVVAPVRQQLIQINNLQDIQSETRDGSAVIRLHFNYGVNTDLAFIEVNERIDAAMNYLPKEISRPYVVKANASDIPVFYMHLTLKEDQAFSENPIDAFLELSELAENVIRKRIEQLPAVAMVDMTGTMSKRIQMIPKEDILQATGITVDDIKSTLENNNIEPGSMQVTEGHYAYNIGFSAVVRTIEDVQNVYIKKNNRIFQLKDIAQIKLVDETYEGLSVYKGKRAITMAVIKRADEHMSQLQEELDRSISHLEDLYPSVSFSKSQNQTELLEYTIGNLKENLIIAFVFVCLVSAFFMHDIKSPLIIGITMFVSLISSLLFFYVFKISLNIVSLTGLVLALGMMIDNSIIVTDNIGQYRKKGYDLDTACVMGTNEVIVPMLSSALTTISVFVPLIFMSGIGGAIFFDQAFSITIGLLVSYLTGIIMLPVLYRVIYNIKIKTGLINKVNKHLQRREKTKIQESWLEKQYHKITDHVFAHKTLTLITMLVILPFCVWMFFIIPKEKIPLINQHELLAQIDWNENIHMLENERRTLELTAALKGNALENSALIGRQQFLLRDKQEQSSTEVELYFKAKKPVDLTTIQNKVQNYLQQNYPRAIVGFAPAGTIFERVFNTAGADLRLGYYDRYTTQIDRDTLQAWHKKLTALTGYSAKSIPFQQQYELHINREKLRLYDIPYSSLYRTLQTAINDEQITTLRSYQQHLTITIGQEKKNIEKVLEETFIQIPPTKANTKAYKYPVKEFITLVEVNGQKNIIAGKNGEFIPFDFYNLTDPEITWDILREKIKPDNKHDIQFSGAFFSNTQMLKELMIVLGVSLLLMYFILVAQFESFLQPLIVFIEIPVAISAALGLLMLLGHSLNLMSAIGIIVTSGIIINDSILKLDIINQLRKDGVELMEAIHEAGRRRLHAILMTSLTSIVCMLPLIFSQDMGSALEKPLALATIGGMLVGTPISLFVVPLIYWFIYRNKAVQA